MIVSMNLPHQLSAVTIVLAFVIIANGTSTYGQQKEPPLRIDQLVDLSTNPAIKNRTRQFIKDTIEPILIGFLPTEATKRDLRARGVPDEIVEVLDEYTALILKVCRFKCENCQSVNGDTLADQLKNAIIDSRLTNNAFRPLMNGGIDSGLCGTDGVNVNETNHVLIFITGEIVRGKRQYQVNATLNYLNYRERGGKQLSRKSWKIKVADTRQELPKLMAEWVLTTLRSAIE